MYEALFSQVALNSVKTDDVSDKVVDELNDANAL